MRRILGWTLLASAGCYSPEVRPPPTVDGSLASDARIGAVDADASCVGLPDGTPCPVGLCREGECEETSCLIGGVWVPVEDVDPTTGCRLCDVSTSRTEWTPIPDGETCSVTGREGLCLGGSCCTGCWNGSTCLSGDTTAACGRAGGDCVTCATQGQCGCDMGLCGGVDFYRAPACNAGVCGFSTTVMCCGCLDSTCSGSPVCDAALGPCGSC